MDFNLSEEQEMLREGIARFVETHYSPEQHRRLVHSDSGGSPEHWQQFAELGWLSLTLPESISGFAFSFEEIAILMEQFGRGLVLEPFASTAVLCARLLEQADTLVLAERTLPKIAEGALKLALAYSEDSSGFDPAQPCSTHALKTAHGYQLSGQKTMVFDGPSADCFIVTAYATGHGLLLALVDRGADGLRCESYPLIDGSRACDLFLDKVVVPDAAVLALGTKAENLLEEAIDRAILARLAEAVGAMEAAMDITAAYIKERQQFGQPIGKFQALQHIMAEMFVESQEARSMLYHGIAHIDAHIENGDAQTSKRAISMAKMAIGRAGHFVAASGIQLHGGYGVTDEYPISHYYKRLMVIEKAYGDSDFHMRRYVSLG